jgi:hypothetical protein
MLFVDKFRLHEVFFVALLRRFWSGVGAAQSLRNLKRM